MDAPASTVFDRARSLGLEAWVVLRADPVTLALPLVLLGLVVGGDAHDPGRPGKWPPDDPLLYLPFFAILGLFALALLVAIFFAYVWAGLMTSRAALDRLDGRPAGLAEALRATQPLVVPASGTLLLWLLVVLVGLVLLVVPGVIAIAGLAPLAPVILCEGRSGVDALRRAWDVTRGRKGEVALLVGAGLLVDLAALALLSWIPIVGDALAGIVGGAVAAWGAVLGAILYRRKVPASATPA
ncbi:MAG TPA: hypothetical protein VHH36_07535 [Candidatus Thermoplasmatota archaeon]|nr:hypothetical protein [Candidatus Thermoplasmatota archaeon]